MCLKYEAHGRRFRPRVLVIGLHPGDYERATVSFTAAAKPRFRLVSGRLVLDGVPVPSIATQRSRIRRWSLTRSRLALWVDRVRLRRLSQADQSVKAERFYATYNPLVSALLSRLQAGLRERGGLLLAVLLPGSRRLRGWNGASADPVVPHLKQILRELKIPLVDPSPWLVGERGIPSVASVEFHAAGGVRGVARRRYFVGGEGHYTAAGNLLVARRLLEGIRRVLATAPD